MTFNSRHREVLTMTTRKPLRKLAPIAMALLLALPAIIVVGVAQAQDTVPIAPTISWVNQAKVQKFYPTFGDDCRLSTASADDPVFQPPAIVLRNPRATSTVPHECSFSTFDPATQAPPVVTLPFGIATTNLNRVVIRAPVATSHSFNVTGSSAFVYFHSGDIPTGVTLSVRVLVDNNPIANGTIDGDSSRSSFSTSLPLLLGQAEIRRGQVMSLELSASAAAIGGVVPPATSTWSISDVGQTRLELLSADALKAATWTTDERGLVKTLFRPQEANLTEGARIVGHFAVRSAFGYEDARSGGDPIFTIQQGGSLIPIGAQRLASLTGELSSTLSQETEARAVWDFPAGYWDYREAGSGEYKLLVEAAYRTGSGFRDLGAERAFFITSQSATLRPFDDRDPATTPSPLENLGHEMLSGSETTYVFLLNNTGNVNDTFRIETQFISGSPPTGWSATVGGPDVLGGSAQVPPGQERIVTVTIAAPRGTASGNNAIHQVRAVSTLDPLVATSPLTLISTVTETALSGVDVIVRRNVEDLEPGVEKTVDVFVWNRGSRAANLSLELRETLRADWKANFLLGGATVKQLQLANVRPGDLARAQLSVSGPIGFGEYEVTLAALNTDLGGAEKTAKVNFILRPTASVRVEILDQINGVGHFAELSGETDRNDVPCGVPLASCVDNGVDGMWFRVWVTNTGKQPDFFNLGIDTVSIRTPNNCGDAAFQPANPAADTFAIYIRNSTGAASAVSGITLEPAQTGEVYVWRAVDRNTDPCNPDTLSFVVTATGRDTRAVARAGTSVEAVDRTTPVSLVLLEPIRRNYTTEAPLVDISRTLALKRGIDGSISIGRNVSYFVRLTHAAAWSQYNADGTQRPDVTVRVENINYDDGWNASIRLALDNRTETYPPWGTSVTFGNGNPHINGRTEGWTDYEIEIRINAPTAANSTAIAGDKDEIGLVAEVAGGKARDSLQITTVIARASDIKVSSDVTRALAHPAEPAAFLLTVANNGSIAAPAGFKAYMNPASTFGDVTRWTVEPAEQAFTLSALKNQTVALLVTPPAEARAGQTGEVIVEYNPNPTDPSSVNVTMPLTVEVASTGTLDLTALSRETTIAPGGFANFTMTLRNTGGVATQYRLTASPLSGWNQTLAPVEATLEAGETRQVVYVLQAPSIVDNGSRFASIVQVEEVGNDANFDTVAMYVNILGGKPIASVSAPSTEKRVDRAGLQKFEVLVRNVGSAPGEIHLEARTSDPTWAVGLLDAQDRPINRIFLAPNELKPVNVTVRAPLTAPENSAATLELTAYSPDFTQSARATLRALIHDYGLQMSVSDTRLDAIPGAPKELLIKLRNTGNDNDTLNVSAILVDLPDWSVDFSSTEVRLESGQETEVRATIKQPTRPLPSPRAYTVRFYASSLEGTAVNVSKNDTLTTTVQVLDYRALDVDGDGSLEVAVDENKRTQDGYETFREVVPQGTQSVVVAVGSLNGKAKFFLDVPSATPYDGIADRWFDPDSVYSYTIRHAVDMNGDASPDYLIDSNRDQKVDLGYDSESDRYWNVIEVKVYGDDRIQFLTDTNGDGRPDRFYDPETKKVTRTLPGDSTSTLGIDTNDDGRSDKIYDTKTGTVTDAKIRRFSDFAQDYWYFFVVFAAMLLITIVLVVRRFRK